MNRLRMNWIGSKLTESLSGSRGWVVATCFALTICLACTSLVTIAIAFLIIQITPTDDANSGAAKIVFEDEVPIITPELSPGSDSFLIISATPFNPPTVIQSTSEMEATLDPQNLHPRAEIEQLISSDLDETTLANLLEANYPPRDYYSGAIRLRPGFVGERTIDGKEYQVGDHRVFYQGEAEVKAELLAVTNYAHYWFESTLRYDPTIVANAANQFEGTYLPLVYRLFGREWRPGVDDDPHFSVLHLDGHSDNSELGFFDSADEYPRTVRSYSNQQELVYLNMENLILGRELYFGTLAHELQHLILWNSDPNEPTWMNEGLSQFIELYLGFKTVNSAKDYFDNPDVQLNSWNYDDPDELFAHYGASYLLNVYLWEQLGDQAIMDLVRHPANGLEAVYAILTKYRPDSSLSEFMSQWSVANYIDDPDVGPQFGYRNLRLPNLDIGTIVDEPFYEKVSQIHQFSADYLELKLTGQASISFAGESHVNLLPSNPPEGELMWFVPPVDELDAMLTAPFDLSGLDEATLQYKIWFDLEEEYDCLYIAVSVDGGSLWEVLASDNTSSCEYGQGLTGRSYDKKGSKDGWISENISLNNYVDRKILLRFELLTDSAIVGQGLAVDDINIPELGYSNGAENADTEWVAKGFVRAGPRFKQSWAVTLIRHGHPNAEVIPLELNNLNQLLEIVDLGTRGSTLVITSMTPFTLHDGTYWLSISQ